MTTSVSILPKTWLIDLDGTVFEHNRYLEGEDHILPGVCAFFAAIPPEDRIVLLTARPEEVRQQTEAALVKFGLRYERILFGLPFGERILINDRKPSGLTTAYAVNVERDVGLDSLIGKFIRTDNL